MSEARLGILGGTFDPVHHGHLLIASELQFSLRLDRVLFVPAGDPPHKPTTPITPARHRTAMLALALENHDRFAIDAVELDRAGPSYTKDTLAVLAAHHPGTRLVFLMGEDSLGDLPTWNRPEIIVALAELGVARRPGIELDLDSVYDHVPLARGRVHVVDVPEVGFASRDIRQRVRDGRPITFHVPPAVERYIVEHRLYREHPG